MIMTAAQYLDDETILKHLPFLTQDEVDEIQKRKAEEDLDRMGGNEPPEFAEMIDAKVRDYYFASGEAEEEIGIAHV